MIDGSSLNPPAGYRRALCCCCAQMRLVKTNYWRGRVGEPAKGEGGDRCLLPLKCQHCRVVTSHAYLLDGDKYADYAEWSEAEYRMRLRTMLGGRLPEPERLDS